MDADLTSTTQFEPSRQFKLIIDKRDLGFLKVEKKFRRRFFNALDSPYPH